MSLMKDPIILCPLCQYTAHRLRHQSGYRCIYKACPNYQQLVAGEEMVLQLKAHLLADRDDKVGWPKRIHWQCPVCHSWIYEEIGARCAACKLSGKGIKCLPASCGPSSSVPVIDGEPIC